MIHQRKVLQPYQAEISDLHAIDSTLKAIEVVSDRYPGHLQKNVNR